MRILVVVEYPKQIDHTKSPENVDANTTATKKYCHTCLKAWVPNNPGTLHSAKDCQ